MNIGEFSDSFLPIVDGVGRVVYGYCNALGNKGHNCYAIVPLTKMGYRGNLPFEIVDYYSAPLPTMPHYRAGLPVVDPHYHARMQMIDFDIIHLHSPFIAGMQAAHYAKKRHIPLVGTFHSKYHDDFLQFTGKEFLADIGVKGIVNVFNNCDEVWAVSETSADTLHSYGYEKEIYVVPNGMDRRIIDAATIAKVKHDYQLNDSPILLFVGQMNWKKNIQRILEACALVRQKGVPFQLILAGQGPHQEEIASRVKELGLAEVTQLVGHISDMKTLDGFYACASLFVFPSIYDNAPMVVREAANAGTPAIVVKGSNAADVIRDQDNGLYCLDDTDDLARVIMEGIADPERLKRIGKAAKETIPIAWEVVIDEVLGRYQRLIERYKEKIR